MIIYHGSKETVENQIKCEHEFKYPCVTKHLKFYQCSKCLCCDYDVESEQEFFKLLEEEIDNLFKEKEKI